jgi:preprotein translocase subunit SecF
MQLFKTPNIPFLKYKYIALALTGAIVLAGVVNVAFFGGLKLGVDFGEGTLLRVIFKDPASVGDIRQQLSDVGLGKSTIQETGVEGREFQIRAMQVAGLGDSDDDLIEAHQALADMIIDALRGDVGADEAARGLRDLNTIDERALSPLLASSFPGSGPEAAQRIISYRTANGIITSFADLAGLGLEPELVKALEEQTYLGGLAVLSRETVGPQAGKDLRRKAVQATVWALIGMLIYIAVRFKLEYGVAAVFTLAQDVLITMSIYSFTSREINLPIIAGVLTIVGFSINDTIVIFDRVRENIKIRRREPLEQVMNLSLNQTLGRTIITSGTLMLTVGALYFFGGEVINDFAFVMLVGTVEGVYSTVALSCPVVLFWQRIFKPKNAKNR